MKVQKFNKIWAIFSLIVIIFLASGHPALPKKDDDYDDNEHEEAQDDDYDNRDHGNKHYWRLRIEERSDLRFPTVVSNTDNNDIIVDPEDSGAAVFDVKGFPYQEVRVFILHDETYMYPVDITQNSSNSSGDRVIKVMRFTYGGSLRDHGRGGEGYLNAQGMLTNMRIGATAKLQNQPVPGAYLGQLILRVVYK
ncbi:MAG: DUF4402 domain-containing protein [SAR324 cluster bacterium]|nr:DUF4402 domain-containing protein [SAR324 cluster bacterium]